MVPSVLTLVLAFVGLKQLSLFNAYGVLIFSYIAGGQVFTIYLLRSFFTTLPNKPLDSAYVDGANIFQVYWRIALSLTRPMLSVVVILNKLQIWNLERLHLAPGHASGRRHADDHGRAALFPGPVSHKLQAIVRRLYPGLAAALDPLPDRHASLCLQPAVRRDQSRCDATEACSHERQRSQYGIDHVIDTENQVLN
jgi:hypothetical protein